MADQPAHSPEAQQEPGQSRSPRRPGRSMSGCGAAIDPFPAACRADRCAKSVWASCAGTIETGHRTPVSSSSSDQRVGQKVGLDERVEQVESRQRSQRDQRNHRQRRHERDARDQEPPRGLPADQHRKHNQSSERLPSTESRRTRSGRHDRATPTCREPLCEEPFFESAHSFERIPRRARVIRAKVGGAELTRRRRTAARTRLESGRGSG